MSIRTVQRWVEKSGVKADQRPLAKRAEPKNKLSDTERARVIEIRNQAGYASLPPSQIVPKLADQGEYIASESSFYRILREADQLHHRGRRQVARKNKAPATHTATMANQVWSWDIS